MKDVYRVEAFCANCDYRACGESEKEIELWLQYSKEKMKEYFKKWDKIWKIWLICGIALYSILIIFLVWALATNNLWTPII